MKQLIIILIITTMVVAERSKYLNAISTRSTAAKGNFLCGKEAAANVKVQLYSKEGDDGKYFIDICFVIRKIIIFLL